MNCTKDNALMKTEPWAQVKSPNVYRLFDRHICPKCRIVKEVELGTVDKNTKGTHMALRELSEKKEGKISKSPKGKINPYPYPYKE